MSAYLVTSGGTPPPPTGPLLLRHDGLLQRPAVRTVEPLLGAQKVLGEVELRLHQLGERHGRRRGGQPVESRLRSWKSCFARMVLYINTFE